MNSTEKIIYSNHPMIRVLAGPGTGKTYSLIQRVARLLSEKYSPQSILVVTFTRTAAKDLISQLESLNLKKCNKVCASTLHSFCFRILARQEVLKITNRNPRTLFEFEEDFLIQDLNNKDFGNKNNKKERLRAFEADWARLQSDEPGWLDDPVDKTFFIELEKWLKFHRAMLIGELIPETLHYLKNNPTSSELLQLKHILVDEYQDLNKAEQSLLDLLSNTNNLIIVGDDDQSIFGFKYAHPEGIIEFPNSHQNTEDINLVECRRCPKKIIDMANHLISLNNRPNKERKIVPSLKCVEGRVHVLQWNTLKEESIGISKIVENLIIREKILPKQILILAPRRVIGYEIKKELRSLNLKACSFFSEESLDSRMAQERYTLLRLFSNPNDRVSLRAWLGFDSPSLRRRDYSYLREGSRRSNLELWDMLEKLERGLINIPYSNSIKERFKKLKKEFNNLQNRNIAEIIDILFPDEPGLELIRDAALEIKDSCNDANELNDELRIKIIQPELPMEVDYIRIMSLHKAKGLTAKVVIITGCVEGFIPSVDKNSSDFHQERQIEECRRLLYVGITRSTDLLFLSSFKEIEASKALKMGAEINYRGKNGGYTIASRFLEQLGNSLPKSILGDRILRNLNKILW